MARVTKRLDLVVGADEDNALNCRHLPPDETKRHRFPMTFMTKI
jgi:hypothetical protein